MGGFVSNILDPIDSRHLDEARRGTILDSILDSLVSIVDVSATVMRTTSRFTRRTSARTRLRGAPALKEC